jgi:uncharacterized protein
MSTRTEAFSFPGSTGAELSGVLHLPGAAPTGSVVLAHCFTCSKDLHTTTRLARGLAEAGYAVLRFDFTGIGDSAGDFVDKTVSGNVGDLVQASTALIQRGYGPCALVGHSLGGAAVLLAAHRVKKVRSVAVLGAPATPGHVRKLLSASVDAIREDGIAEIEIAGRTFPLARGFLDDLERHDQAGRVAELARPLLVLHAVDDEVVDVAEGERIFAAARQPKAFVPLFDSDHLLVDRSAAERALAALVSWLRWTL